jgi:hypothetical protein
MKGMSRMKGLAIKSCSFCGKQNIRKGHEKKCVERLRVITPRKAKTVIVDEIQHFQGLKKRIERHQLPDLTSDMHAAELRKEFKARFPAANDPCPHCQADGASIKHQADCPNGEPRETKSINETYVPPEFQPAVHWKSIFYIKISEGTSGMGTDIPLGTWIPRAGIDRGDRSEADLERDGWVRADGRFVKSVLEFPKTPNRVPDLFPRFLPHDLNYIGGLNNMLPIYWGDHV